MVNFHLPLPEELHAGLRAEAFAEGRPATTLARELVMEGLRERRRRRIREELRAFADAEAGGPLDLDPAWEQAGLEAIREEPS